MRIYPSNTMVKQLLQSHSWIGLVVGALMYLICLSGTIVVFFETLERWEQPNIEEYETLSPSAIDLAVEQFLSRVDQVPDSLYVVLPTEALPRAHVSDGDNEWYVDADGMLLDPPVEGWTTMLKSLHINLHLPETLGIILVGILGVMLCGLVVSGIFSHPRILKDAFKFRLFSSTQLAHVDLHNRLSVWGLPFHFMIGLTGAYIGLVGIVIAIAAPIMFQGDRQAVIDEVYGGDPVVNQPVVDIRIGASLDTLESTAPGATPIYMVFQNLGTTQQFVEIAATLPGRLIYSEIYRFDVQGNSINHQGLSDGPIGRQVAYSVYRLHFGHFDGVWVKVIYLVLGFALTIIAVSGINIWLVKRKYISWLNFAWDGFVWGLPVAMVFSASASLFYPPIAVLGFWSVVIASLVAALMIKNLDTIRSTLQAMLAFGLILLVVCHNILFPFQQLSSISWQVNTVFLVLAVGFLWHLRHTLSAPFRRMLGTVAG